MPVALDINTQIQPLVPPIDYSQCEPLDKNEIRWAIRQDSKTSHCAMFMQFPDGERAVFIVTNPTINPNSGDTITGRRQTEASLQTLYQQESYLYWMLGKIIPQIANPDLLFSDRQGEGYIIYFSRVDFPTSMFILKNGTVVIDTDFFGKNTDIAGKTEQEINEFLSKKAWELAYEMSSLRYRLENNDGLAKDALPLFMASRAMNHIPPEIAEGITTSELLDTAVIEWVYQHSNAGNMQDFAHILQAGYNQTLDANMQTSEKSLARALTNLLRNSDVASKLDLKNPSISQLRDLFIRSLFDNAEIPEKMANTGLIARDLLIAKLEANKTEMYFTSSGKQVARSDGMEMRLLSVHLPPHLEIRRLTSTNSTCFYSGNTSPNSHTSQVLCLGGEFPGAIIVDTGKFDPYYNPKNLKHSLQRIQ